MTWWTCSVMLSYPILRCAPSPRLPHHEVCPFPFVLNFCDMSWRSDRWWEAPSWLWPIPGPKQWTWTSRILGCIWLWSYWRVTSHYDYPGLHDWEEFLCRGFGSIGSIIAWLSIAAGSGIMLLNRLISILTPSWFPLCNAGIGDLLWHNEKQLHFDKYFEYHKQRGPIPKLKMLVHGSYQC